MNASTSQNTKMIRCTNLMCPIRVHWHVKLNYKEYWRVKMIITNFNYQMNYTQWTLVAQHPNFNNITQVFSFDCKPLIPYQSTSKSSLAIPTDDTGMFYGLKYYNNVLIERSNRSRTRWKYPVRVDSS
ncbi:hypothetical protein CRYUN_Cryun12cG0160700 [Craigia yunnanensis]